MERALSAAVRQRARRACEYCRFPESESPLPFCVDHIIARQHDGGDVLDNLALACAFCNSHKGPNLAGIDPETGQLVRLYHPRRDRWADHFRWDGIRIVPTSPVGRATVAVLAMNHEFQLAARTSLVRSGWVFAVGFS